MGRYCQAQFQSAVHYQLNWELALLFQVKITKTRWSSIVSQPIKVVVHIDVVVVVFIVVVVAVVVIFVVDPRNLPLKCGQNWVPSS